MAEPTSALSVYDLILIVAKAAEIAYYGTTGQEKAMIPIDPVDLDRCLDVVNSAIRDFIATAPAGGWHWRDREMEITVVQAYTGTAESGTATNLTDSDIAGDYADDYFNSYVLYITSGTGAGEYATVTDYTGSTGAFDFSGGLSGGSTPDDTSEYRIARSTQTILGDASRYLLSQDFQGEVTGDVTFAAGSNACGIEWVDEAQIRQNRETTVVIGDAPFIAAIKPYSTRRRWELMLDPTPSASYTIVFPYKANFDKLELIAGDASAGDSTSLTDDDLAGLYPDDYFIGDTIRIMSGTGKTSYAVVTDYTGSTGKFTVADWLYRSGAAGGTDPGSDSIYYIDSTDQHPAGLQFDAAIESAILARTEQEFTDVNRSYLQKFLNVDLPAAYLIDGRTRPRTLGKMKSGSGPRFRIYQRDAVTYRTNS